MAKRPIIRGHETARAVPEWIGRSPDTRCPDRVIQRIAERCGWRCHISGAVIDQVKQKYGRDWQLEHIVPLESGGENRESNLAPALNEWHKIKTAAESKERGKRNRSIRKRAGISASKRPLPCGKGSPYKKKPGDHRLYWRDSGEPVR